MLECLWVKAQHFRSALSIAGGHQGFIFTWGGAYIMPAIKQARLATAFLFYNSFSPKNKEQKKKEKKKISVKD